jgi:hypothetical protein
MSEAAEKKIAELEQRARVAEELLFLVLDTIDEPVSFDVDEAKAKMSSDRIIDLQLDDDHNLWTLQVITVGQD